MNQKQSLFKKTKRNWPKNKSKNICSLIYIYFWPLSHFHSTPTPFITNSKSDWMLENAACWLAKANVLKIWA